MRAKHLHDVIATDIPKPVERAPLELDEDITGRDAWMFAPLIAASVALPIVATVMLAFSAWHLVNSEPSLTAPQSTFAMRWPDQTLPVIR